MTLQREIVGGGNPVFEDPGSKETVLNIRIGPFDYEVVLVPDLKDDDGESCDGLYRHSEGEIRVNDALGEQAREVTIWH